MTITGTSGDDINTGTTGIDTFDLSQGGNDTASGLDGGDTFLMGATLNALDAIDGGGGTDLVQVNGDYSGANALILAATTLVNVEMVQFAAGHSYTLTTNDANAVTGNSLTFNGSFLGIGDTLIVDSSAETNASIGFTAGAGENHFIGSQVFNIIHFDNGIALGTDDTIIGAGGNDTLLVGGVDYVSFVFLPGTMTGVSQIQFAAGNDYDLTTDDATIEANTNFSVAAHLLGPNDTITFDASAETDGRIIFHGGKGLAFVTGGAQSGDLFDYNNNSVVLLAGDQLDGGGGNDTLFLKNDYSAGLVLNGTLRSIERLQLGAGYNYDLTTDDGTIAVGKTFDVDGTYLNAGDGLNFNGGAESDGAFIFRIIGGVDALRGGAKNDTFYMYGSLTASDAINGDSGADLVDLNGDYAAMTFFNATTLVRVETLQLHAGHSYSFTTVDATVNAGKALKIHAGGLGASDVLTFNGGQEANGSFKITSGAGDDSVRGGVNDDLFKTAGGDDKIATGSGDDIVQSGGGKDTITLGASLTTADTIDGGSGTDTVELYGLAYASGFTFTPSVMVNVEALKLGTGATYNLTTDDATVAASANLKVYFSFSPLGPGGALLFDGSAETDGTFDITGAEGNNDIVGGALGDDITTLGGDDQLEGGGGADKLDSGLGADVFVYNTVSDSTGTTRDRIVGLDLDSDKFDIAGTITAVETDVTTGLLRSAHFNADLHDDLVGHLHAHRAVLFTADSGNQAGVTFLVIDANGTAGYQSNADLVIRVDGVTGTLDSGDFI